MSADASVTLAWAGEDRKFRLGIGQLRELQENVNRWRVAIGGQTIGPRTLLRLLSEGDAWPDEIREIIRLGLIGGGMKIERVPSLIKRYVDDRPMTESAQVAQAVLIVALVGAPDDSVGKKPTAETEEQTSSSSPPSTELDVSSDSHPNKSIECPSGSSPPVSTVSTEPTVQKMSPRQ